MRPFGQFQFCVKYFVQGIRYAGYSFPLQISPGPNGIPATNSSHRSSTMKTLFSFSVTLSLIIYQLLCHLISLSSTLGVPNPYKVLPPQPAVVSGILSGQSAAKYGPFKLAPGDYVLFMEWITPGIPMSMQPLFFSPTLIKQTDLIILQRNKPCSCLNQSRPSTLRRSPVT